MQRQLELSTLDGCRIEPLVDDPRHLLGAGLDDGGQLALLARLRTGGEQARGADHGVELVAELMAEVGQHVGIDMHDMLRMAVGAVPLGWSAELAKLAHQYSSSGAGCSVGVNMDAGSSTPSLWK